MWVISGLIVMTLDYSSITIVIRMVLVISGLKLVLVPLVLKVSKVFKDWGNQGVQGLQGLQGVQGNSGIAGSTR